MPVYMCARVLCVHVWVCVYMCAPPCTVLTCSRLGSVSTLRVCVSPFPRAHVCHGMCRERMHLPGGSSRVSWGLPGLVAGSGLGQLPEADPGLPAGVSPEGVRLGGVGGGAHPRAAADSQPPTPSFPDPLGFCLSVCLSLKLRLQEEQRTKEGGTGKPSRSRMCLWERRPEAWPQPHPASRCLSQGRPRPRQVSGHSWTPVTSSP